MKKIEVRFWKTLERHPLSQEYEDISGVAWDNFVSDLDEFGVLDRRVTIHEGKVLDGWQLLRACIECDAKPEFAGLPKGVTPEEFVRIKNDNRRHEENELVAARRERVAKARAEGKSTRVIAEQEGVSQSTIRDDVQVSAPDYSPESEKAPEPPKVTGADGKSYPATKPKILCERCTRVGETKDCEACKEARKPKPPAKPPKAGKPKFDEKKFDKAFGGLTRVVDERGNAMGKGPHHMRCQQILGDFISEYKLWKKETA